MLRSVVCVLVALVAGFLVYLLVAPHLLKNRSNPFLNTPASSANASSSVSTPYHASLPQSEGSAPLEVPQTEEQKEIARLESNRVPFYTVLQQTLGAAVTRTEPAANDPATLELYVTRSEESITGQIADILKQTNARHYGFKKALVYLPNPPDDFQRYHIDAEATYSDTGIWNVFRK